jgi:hypothetical protein
MPDSDVPIKDATGAARKIDVRSTSDDDLRQVVLIGDRETDDLISPASEETLAEVATALGRGEDPLVGIDTGGIDVTGEAQVLVTANPARVKVDGMNATDGRVWLGYGEAAAIGNGLFVEPGGYFGEFTTDEVSIIAEPGAVGRMTWQEWGA